MKKMAVRFSRKYWEGGARYSDWFTLYTYLDDNGKPIFYRIGYYANLGSMVSDVSKEQHGEYMEKWLINTVIAPEPADRGVFKVDTSISDVDSFEASMINCELIKY